MASSKRFRRILRDGVLVMMAVIMLFPIIWIVMSSFKTKTQLTIVPPLLFFKPHFHAYKAALEGGFAHSFLDSLLISGGSVILSLIFGIPAAYALARFKFKGRENLKFYILSLRMAPPIGFIVAYYLVLRNLKLLDTHVALIVIYLSFNLPLVIWLLIGLIQEVPVALEEAGWVDGCTKWEGLIRIVMPNITHGIAISALLAFVYSWQEFLFAFTVAGGKVKTVPVAISCCIGLYGIEWDKMCAYATLSLIPMLIIALFAQKYLVRGVTLGGVKG